MEYKCFGFILHFLFILLKSAIFKTFFVMCEVILSNMRAVYKILQMTQFCQMTER